MCFLWAGFRFLFVLWEFPVVKRQNMKNKTESLEQNGPLQALSELHLESPRPKQITAGLSAEHKTSNPHFCICTDTHPNTLA